MTCCAEDLREIDKKYVVFGYIRRHYHKLITDSLIKLCLEFYDETTYFQINNELLNMFISTKNGEKISSEPIKYHNTDIQWNLSVYPNGFGMNTGDIGYIRYFVEFHKLPTNIKSITALCKLSVHVNNSKILTSFKMAAIFGQYLSIGDNVHRLKLSKLMQCKNIKFVCYLQILNICYHTDPDELDLMIRTNKIAIYRLGTIIKTIIQPNNMNNKSFLVSKLISDDDKKAIKYVYGSDTDKILNLVEQTPEVSLPVIVRSLIEITKQWNQFKYMNLTKYAFDTHDIKINRYDKYGWKIRDDLLQRFKECEPCTQFQSMTVGVGGNWCFQLSPNGEDKHKNGDVEFCLALLRLPNKIKSINMDCELEIVTDKTCKKCREIVDVNHEASQWIWSEHVLKNESLLLCSVITITATMEILHVFDHNENEIDKNEWKEYGVQP